MCHSLCRIFVENVPTFLANLTKRHTESFTLSFPLLPWLPFILVGPMCQGNPLKNLWPMNHPKSLRHLTVHSCKLNVPWRSGSLICRDWNFQVVLNFETSRVFEEWEKQVGFLHLFFCGLFHFMLSEVAKISVEIFSLPGLEWSRPPQMAVMFEPSGRSLVSFTETISDCKKHLKLVPTHWKIIKKIRSIAISRWDFWNAVASCVFSWSCTSCSKIEQLHSK